MYCPLTGKPCSKPKTIHVTDAGDDGEINNLHICEECTGEIQKTTHLPVLSSPQALEILSSSPLNSIAFFLQLVKQLEERHRDEEVLNVPCPSCGQTLREFANTSKIGCGTCYEFFKAQLLPVIQRVQDGAIQHVGKCPKADAEKLVLANIESLTKKMTQAAKEERYEDAACIRDQIAFLKAKLNSNS